MKNKFIILFGLLITASQVIKTKDNVDENKNILYMECPEDKSKNTSWKKLCDNLVLPLKILSIGKPLIDYNNNEENEDNNEENYNDTRLKKLHNEVEKITQDRKIPENEKNAIKNFFINSNAKYNIPTGLISWYEIINSQASGKTEEYCLRVSNSLADPIKRAPEENTAYKRETQENTVKWIRKKTSELDYQVHRDMELYFGNWEDNPDHKKKCFENRILWMNYLDTIKNKKQRDLLIKIMPKYHYTLGDYLDLIKIKIMFWKN